VLPVGGIREKILASHRAGLKKVVIPARNEKDLEDVPKSVLKKMELITVSHMDQVLPVALHAPKETGHSHKRKGIKKSASETPDAAK
jgi:ATP-dependent Lon protease